jgi:hypothetical protein
MYRAARALLPRFELGCWSRCSLGGAAATTSYHTYHVELLRRLALTHPRAGIWWSTYVAWSRCLGMRPRERPLTAIVWRRGGTLIRGSASGRIGG